MASEGWVDKVEGILPLLILGAGFVALFAGVEWFFLIWILGFAVFLPIVVILLEGDEEEESLSDSIDSTFATIGTAIRGIDRGFHDHVEPAIEGREPRRRDADADDGDGSTVDALEILRERYARGDLTDEQFERKLDRLLETTTPENAVEWRRSRHEVGYENARKGD